MPEHKPSDVSTVMCAHPLTIAIPPWGQYSKSGQSAEVRRTQSAEVLTVKLPLLDGTSPRCAVASQIPKLMCRGESGPSAQTKSATLSVRRRNMYRGRGGRGQGGYGVRVGNQKDPWGSTLSLDRGRNPLVDSCISRDVPEQWGVTFIGNLGASTLRREET